MKRHAFNAPDAPAPIGGYAQALAVTGATQLLFVSGQVPTGMDGAVPPTFIEQARLAWRNLEAQLKAAGMSLDNLTKITTFLADRRYGSDNRVVRQEFLGDRRLANTVIITGIFDETWLLEIEAIAAA